MDLKGLVHRELGEGLTEAELASAVGVSVQTIADILLDELPPDPAVWETFARYFRIHADFLRSGGPPHAEELFELTESTHPSPPRPDEEGAASEVGSNRPDGRARAAASSHPRERAA
ncbi:hypothetical protein AYO43_08410 [Nitrospira sp. SCGC AG-212-E16]|nr:hypothetical protein AYO43_08410 [Nitrospira sp. SCGC AG-212-E16]